jgi:aminoglycoside phosphotransferase (APT) family kinase protein
MYGNAREFFETEVPLWLESLEQAEKALGEREAFLSLREGVERLMRARNDMFALQKPVLVHGDMLNPGNILLSGKTISGIIDWEWANAGDPAWEFAFTNTYDLTRYFQAFPEYTEKERKSFLARVAAYKPFWLLWGAHVHAGNPRGDVYRILRDELLKNLA